MEISKIFEIKLGITCTSNKTLVQEVGMCQNFAMNHINYESIEPSITDPRSRRVVRPTTHRTVGRNYSVKSARTIHWESQLEKYCIYHLEFDPGVKAFAEQPKPIRYESEGRIHTYTPDFYIEHNHGRAIIEVKPSDQAVKPEWQRLFEIASEIYQSMGISYHVRTEVEIQKQPRLLNTRKLLRYVRHNITREQKELILNAVSSAPMSLEELIEFVGGPSGYQDVCRLIAKGLLTCDMDEEFSEQVLIRFATEVPRWRP